MNQREFLEVLKRASRKYNWVRQDGRLFAYSKSRGSDDSLSGKTVRMTPIMVVAAELGVTGSTDSVRAKRLGLDQSFVNDTTSTSNRGNAQVLRGRMLDVVNAVVRN